MRPDETYRDRSDLAPARLLQHAGRWDDALTTLGASDQVSLDLRADILVDRHSWQHDDRTEALHAIAAASEPLSTFLIAQVDYTTRLARVNGTSTLAGLPDLVNDPIEDFLRAAKATPDNGFGDWALFWYAVSTENLRDDTATARPVYAEVATRATARDEPVLASYANRHLGALLLYEDGDTAAGLDLIRLSLHQRAATGARAQVAAQQSLLAMALDDLAATPPGTTPAPATGTPNATEESRALRTLVSRTAHELDLAWLK